MKKLSLISLFAGIILLAQPVSQTMAMDADVLHPMSLNIALQGMEEFFKDTRSILLDACGGPITVSLTDVESLKQLVNNQMIDSFLADAALRCAEPAKGFFYIFKTIGILK